MSTRLTLKLVEFGTAVRRCGEVGHVIRLSCWCAFRYPLDSFVIINRSAKQSGASKCNGWAQSYSVM